MIEVYQKGDIEIPYKITYKNVKYTYFRVKDDYISISTNRLTSKKQILKFIDLKFDKFHQYLSQVKSVHDDLSIRLWGKTYQIMIERGRFSYQMDEDTIRIKSLQKEMIQIKRRIYKVELEHMLNMINDEIIETIKKVGLNKLPIRMKYLRSKFGSYHRKNVEITLNTFLSTLDPIYLKYVIYHEYAHALVFNHSKDFYNLLDKLMLNHRVYQKDLKKIAII